MIIFYTGIQCSRIICEDKFDKLINLFFALQSFCHSKFSSCWGISISQHHNPPIPFYLYTMAFYFENKNREYKEACLWRSERCYQNRCQGFASLGQHYQMLDPKGRGIFYVLYKFSFSIPSADPKFYYRALLIKTSLYWHKKRNKFIFSCLCCTILLRVGLMRRLLCTASNMCLSLAVIFDIWVIMIQKAKLIIADASVFFRYINFFSGSCEQRSNKNIA